MWRSIHHSKTIFNYLKELKLCQILSHIAICHIMSILIAMFSRGYRGKTVDFALCSNHHRTTIGHFLNYGKWKDEVIQNSLKQMVIGVIYQEAERSGQPIFCIVDDTIASRTKPSSQALHPIENAYFHQSHLKKKQDYGHQAIAVLLSCNGITLNYTVLLYDKSMSKIQMVCNLAQELPIAPVHSYFLCDSWYTAGKVMDSFIKRGFYTIGALKTNRILYPAGIRQKLSQFALFLHKTDAAVRLVTVGNRQYYVYRYEGKLNGLENAVVLMTYPKDAFHKPQALRAFLCSDTSLSTEEILTYYQERWGIEVYFRQCKTRLAFDQCQIRSAQGIQRFWLLTSLAYNLCCMATGTFMPFDEGYRYIQKQIQQEEIVFLYQCGVNHLPLEQLLTYVA